MIDDPLHIFRTIKLHGVPFVIIGGHAVSVHSEPRATQDCDIVYLRTPATEESLLLALMELQASWISNEKDPATGWERQIPISLGHIQTRSIMWLITAHGFLDIIDHIPGHPKVPVQELISSAITVDGLPYASRDWLIRMKKAAGRAKDLLDLENLEANSD